MHVCICVSIMCTCTVQGRETVTFSLRSVPLARRTTTFINGMQLAYVNALFRARAPGINVTCTCITLRAAPVLSAINCASTRT